MSTQAHRLASKSKEIDDLHAQIYGPKVKPDAAADPADGETQEAAGDQGEKPAQNGAEAPGPAGQEGVQGAQDETEASAPTNYKQEYDSLKGKYDAELPRLQQELKSTREMLAAMSTAEKQSIVDKLDAGGLTEQEIDDYGPELIEVIKKAAREEFVPVVQQMEAQNTAMRERLAKTSEDIDTSSEQQMLADLKMAVPDCETLNNDKGFLDWLNQPDLYSGSTRQQLLVTAYNARDTRRLIAFFQGYKQEQTGQPAPAQDVSEAQSPGLETLIAPGRPAATADTGAQKSGKIWSKAEVQHYADLKRKGKMSPEQAQAFDEAVHLAGREGRIR